MRLDGFIEAEEVERRSVKHCCDMFEVSRTAYYRRKKQVPSAREVSDRELVEKIRQVHAESAGSYGAPGCTTARAPRGGVRPAAGAAPDAPARA